MIKFLLKGILNDRSRSLLPVIVVGLGVALTVLLTCFMEGVFQESITMNANFTTGHVKIITRAFAEDESHLANDLALIETDNLMNQLSSDHPQIIWEERIRFGGLIDFPDTTGETRAQGPVLGWGIDLFSPESQEIQRFNLADGICSGKLPSKPGEALITDDFAKKYGIAVGDPFTLFGTTMDGSMAFHNFTVAGTVRFGTMMIDKGSVIIDITDAREALRMEDAATEILGFFPDDRYHDEEASVIAAGFNRSTNPDDEFAPVMLKLKEQGGLADYLDLSQYMRGIFVFVFVMAMSVVLWNTGLLGGLRRYTEFGLRLAMGEEKRHIYRTLIYEGILIGAIGSVLGTLVGLGFSYYLQEVGFSFGDAMQSSTIMFPNIIKARIIPSAFYIGFIPGVIAMVMGNALSGRAIYKRQTSQLFKELEN
ncbi:MAG: FtsX-like permease family protein [Bacteroidales bacterium]